MLRVRYKIPYAEYKYVLHPCLLEYKACETITDIICISLIDRLICQSNTSSNISNVVKVYVARYQKCQQFDSRFFLVYHSI